LSNTTQAAPAATVTAFSTYLIGLCIAGLVFPSIRHARLKRLHDYVEQAVF
jgi:hypothetical protein